MPLTNAQKKKRQADKKAKEGLVRICEWGTPQQKTEIREYLAGRAQIVRINPLDKYDGRVY